MTIITYLCHPDQGITIHRDYSDLRALSIQPPWIEEILKGTKTEEYRTWSTKRRGQFLLHECTPKGRGLVGAADISYCYEIEDESYAFGLENIIKFPQPIPCPGNLNFWFPKRPEQHRAFEIAIAILKNI